MKVSDFLNESTWTKGALARNATGNCLREDGHIVLTGDSDAAMWCLQGAVYRAYFLAQRPSIIAKINAHITEKYSYNNGVANFNDLPSTKWEDIAQIVKELDL